MAAVLSCGGTAVLSHLSAGALWGIREERGPNGAFRGGARGPRPHEAGAYVPIDVSVRTCSHRAVAGVRLHRRGGLRDTDVTVHEGIPVTTPIQTLIDLAGETDSWVLERAVNEADKLDLVDPTTLLEALDGTRRVVAWDG